MKNIEIDNTQDDSENEIDLMEIIKKLKNHKRFIIKVCIFGFIFGIVVAFSIPKEYTTSVILAQSSSEKSTGGLGALASMAGIDLQQSTGGELSPLLYPDILASTPFILGLFDIQVKDSEKKIETSLYNYLNDYQKSAWWSYVIGLPFKLLSVIRSSDETGANGQASDSKIITLTREQNAILESLKNRIKISMDKKTGIATIDVTMQSPVISAVIADTIISYMQSYIIKYRTEKAGQNLEYVDKLYNEAQENYFVAQKAYAEAEDKNLDIVSAKYRTNLVKLQNEMNLTYNIYNQTAQQLQLAKIKLEDTKPVCVIIQPAVIPSHPSKPKKTIILAGFMFLAFAGACGWIFLKDMFSGKKEENEISI